MTKVRKFAFQINQLEADENLHFDVGFFHRIYKHSLSPNSQTKDFGMNFAKAAVDFTVKSLNSSNFSDKSIRLADAVLELNDEHFAYAVECYKKMIIKAGNSKIVSPHGDLTNEYKVSLLQSFANGEKCTDSKRRIVIEVMQSVIKEETSQVDSQNIPVKNAALNNVAKLRTTNSKADKVKNII